MSSLIDSMSAVKKYSGLTGSPTREFFGKVVFNADPKQIARIKVSIDNLIPWDDEKKLPWIYNEKDPGLRGPLPSGLKIPTVGGWVLCYFPYDSIYIGFYRF